MAHWRDSARNVRFFIIDYRASFPLLFCLVHFRLWTFVMAILFMVFFGLLERFGFTVSVFARWVRSYIAGPRKIAQPWWKI